jgi:nucleotide-binding universal stress UspA family protein
MTEPAPVVVGFDARSSSADALALARSYGRATGSRLIVVVVHPAPAAISPGRVDAEWIADRHRKAEEILNRARELMGSEEPAEFRVVASSSAAHGLHDVAEGAGAGLIVVGSQVRDEARGEARGVAREERMFAGSTADRLLSGSASAVAVAPPGLSGRSPVEWRRIGVAYIEEPESVAALTAAAAVALAAGGELHLYTVVAQRADLPPLTGRDAERAVLASAREYYQTALDSAIKRLPAGLRASGHLLTGDVVEVLADLDRTDLDVLYCGSRGYGPVRRVLLGGVSSRLIRRARSPLVVVPR